MAHATNTTAASAFGTIVQAATGPIRVLRIEPGGSKPGGYPVTIYPGGRTTGGIEVNGPCSLYFHEGLATVDIRGATPNATYTIRTSDDPGDAFGSSEKGEGATNVAPAGTAVPTVAPAAPTDGFQVFPGWPALSLLLTGGALVTVYVQSVAGNWYQSGDQYQAPGTFTLAPQLRGGRVYFRANAGGTTLELDAATEIG